MSKQENTEQETNDENKIEQIQAEPEASVASKTEEVAPAKPRRRRSTKKKVESSASVENQTEQEPSSESHADSADSTEEKAEEAKPKPRRPRRRRSTKKVEATPSDENSSEQETSEEMPSESADFPEGQEEESKPKPRRSRRRRSTKKVESDPTSETPTQSDAPEPSPEIQSEPEAAEVTQANQEPSEPKKTRRRRSGRRRKGKDESVSEQNAAEPNETPLEKPEQKTSEPKKTEPRRESPRRETTPRDDGVAREMLINVAQEEECRIAIVEKGQLEELYVERSSSSRHVGNIYKGVITNIEPSIQACFIDFGIGQNGFLHISDLQTSFFPNNNQKERVGCKRPRRERPPIQDCLKRGQELVVQVIKEGIGTKGPTLTTYLSIPGRFMVLMPGMNRSGISRKIEDDDARNKLRDMLKQLDPPKDMGVIIRTAGIDRAKRDLQRDLNYLLRLWKTVSAQEKKLSGPQELYKESDLVIRTLRDVFNSNVKKIICDCEETITKIKDFLHIAMPRTRCPIIFHDHPSPLFAKNRIEEKIAEIQSRHVPLRSGGSLVIDPTEALVAIDVNSGKNRSHDSAEMTAYKINVEAAKEISRQLRLRDLGGVIIIDFIDMLQEKHRRGVEREFREATSNDRARTKILRISQFGIVEMTRQRMRPSFERSRYMDCPHCRGGGLIKTPESMSIEIMRSVQSVIAKSRVESIEIEVSSEVAAYVQNKKRALLTELESSYKKSVVVKANSDFSNDEDRFTARDSRGSMIKGIF